MIEQINNIALSWWGWMIGMLWQVSLLIILIACIDAVIKRWAWPQLRYALWLLVLLKLVVPPSISMPGSLTGRLQPIADRIVSSAITESEVTVEKPVTFVVSEPAVTIPAITSSSETTIEPQSTDTISENYVVTAPAAETASPVRFLWQSYAMALWLLGMSVLGVWLFVRLHRLRACQAKDDQAYSMPSSFHGMMSRCAAQLRLHHIPRVVVTDQLFCPAVFGIFRPVLLMPKNYLSKLSRKDAEHMLLHELAHIKRGDTIVHGIYLLLQIAYWFNPLLWLARRQLHHLRELCCDATVARLLKNKTCEYRETLIDVARRFLARPVEPSLGLLGLFEDTNRLLVRLNWLEKQTWRYHKMKNLIVITITALMLAFVLPMAKAQDKPSAEEQTTGSELTEEKSSQDIEVKKEDDKYVATTEINSFAKVKPNTPFVVRNKIGNIILVPGKDDNCAINAVIQARAKTADEAKELIDMVSIESQSSKERYFLRPVKSGDDKWNDLSVTFNITVPLGVLPDIKTDLGNIVMTDLEGQIKAATDLGKVKAINTTGNIELHSNLGDIEFTAPKNLSAKIQASTNMGSIKSNLPLNIEKADMFRRKAVATFGDGRNDINLSTNMGTVHISTEPENTGEAVTQVETVSGRNFLSKFMPSSGSSENIRKVKAINEKKQGNRHVIEREEKMAAPLSPGSVLDITNEDGNITILGSDIGECQVESFFTIKAPTEEAAKELSKEVSLEMTPTSKGLSVKVDHPENTPSNHSYSADLQIKIPRNTNVTLHNEDGNITIKDLDGQIKVYIEDGNIRCENVSAEVELKHEDGNIDIIESRLTNCKINKEDGNIMCGNVSGNVDFKLEDGNINISYADDVSEKSTVSVRGEDGNVKINGGIFAECKVNRESGAIKCNKVSGNLDLKLENGSITVDYADNVPEDCAVNAKLEEGSIQLSAPGEMFPPASKVTKKGDGARWISKTGNRNVNLKVDEGSIKVDKR
jgi:beta-lactamase regulating signal transducer with metallopeptidase domain